MSNFILGDLNTKFKVGSADCRVYLGDTCVYSGDTPTPHDYSADYLTYVALGDNFVLSWSTNFTNLLSYSLDSGATWSEPSIGFEVTLANSGDTIMLKGSGMTSSNIYPIGNLRPDFTVDYKVQGNIMSLLFGDNFANQTDLTGYASAFKFFFQGATKTTPNEHLLSVENLVLPATTLAQSCYASMFLNCKSITTAPILPAATLTLECYQAMFRGCTSLNSITCLATDISASNCINGWTNNVAASGTFTKAASMTSWTSGTSGLPSGWTVVDYNG